MCKPVQYVYPHCGHPIVQDKDVWSVERCPFAQCCGRDCWIPNDIPEQLIEDTPWPYDNLTEPCPMPHQPSPIPHQPCYVSHERGISTESATLPASSTQGDQSSCVEFTFSDPPTPLLEWLDDEEMDRIIQEFFFQDSLPGETSGEIPDEDVFHLDNDDLTLPEDTLLLNEDDPRQNEAHLTQEPLYDDQFAYFDEMIAQTSEELSFASMEDSIEWEQVQAVQAPLEQDIFAQDMDWDWRFDEWF